MISSNPATGNLAARDCGDLNTRTFSVLDVLQEYRSHTIISVTCDEVAIFTISGHRLIYRGEASCVPITPEIESDLSSQVNK